MTKTQIAVHCSFTPTDMFVDAALIKHWHVEGNRWRDIGYNAVILRDGTIEAGRDLDDDGDWMEEVGAHARGHNREAIGICLVGGMSDKGEPEANYTMAQYVSLEAVIRSIEERYGRLEVLGHCDYPDTDKPCPCFNVKALLGR